MQSFYTVSLYLFLLAIILFRLPNIYVIPFVTSGLFTTQAIARVILGGLFFVGVAFSRKSNFFNTKGNKIVTVLLLCFLLFSSLSLIWAQNLDAFFTRYKDILIGIVSFFVFQYFAKEKKKIVIALLIPIPLNIIYQFFLLYGKSVFFILQNIIYQKHFDLVSYNLYRGRIYLDVYDEACIPLVVLLLRTKKKVNLILSSISLLLISSLAFLSNFRTRILMLLLSIGSSFVALQKVTVKKLLYSLLFIVCISVVVGFISSFRYGYTFYDRFLLTNMSDIRTVFSRYEQIGTALEMGLVSPFGVGLGNYPDMLVTQRGAYYAYIRNSSQSTAYQYVHNNFAIVIAETGYITFFIYTLLIATFLFMDIKTLRKNDRYRKAFVLSFWTLFFFGLFNPPIPGSYQVLFWGMRGLLVDKS